MTIPHYLISGKQANQRVSLLRNVGFQNSGIKVSGDENIQRALQHEINDGANAPAGALAMVELQNQINNTEDYLPKENFIELLVAMDNLTKSLTMEGVD